MISENAIDLRIVCVTHSCETSVKEGMLQCSGNENNPPFLQETKEKLRNLFVFFLNRIFILDETLQLCAYALRITSDESLYSMKPFSFRLAFINVCPVLVPSELLGSTHLPTTEGWTAELTVGFWLVAPTTGFEPTRVDLA